MNLDLNPGHQATVQSLITTYSPTPRKIALYLLLRPDEAAIVQKGAVGEVKVERLCPMVQSFEEQSSPFPEVWGLCWEQQDINIHRPWGAHAGGFLGPSCFASTFSMAFTSRCLLVLENLSPGVDTQSGLDGAFLMSIGNLNLRKSCFE